MPGPYYTNTKIDDVDVIEAQDLDDIEAGFAAVEADILTKPVTQPGAGNLASFSASGELGDSGKAPPVGDILGKAGALPQDNIAIFNSIEQIIDSNKQLPVSDIAGRSGTFVTNNIPIMNAIDELVDSGKSLPSGDIAGTSDTQALTNKIITDVVRDFSGGGSFVIDPKLGAIQTLLLTSNGTPTAANFDNGDSVFLKIDDGAAYTIDWTGLPVFWVSSTVPTLAPVNYTMIRLFKIGPTIYGEIIGDVTV